VKDEADLEERDLFRTPLDSLVVAGAVSRPVDLALWLRAWRLIRGGYVAYPR